MSDLAASIIEHESDYRAWIAIQRIQSARPPYSQDFQVTPLSKFGDHYWKYPKDWLPTGHRSTPYLDFRSARAVPSGKTFRLSFSEHAMLVQQFKEVLVAMIFSRTLLPGRVDAAKPLTILNNGQRLGQLFANFAAAGIKSLSDLTQKRLSAVFETIPVEPKSHLALIGHFKDMVVLSNEGLISDGLSLPNAFVEMREVAEDQTRPRGAATLDEDNTSFLLGHSRTYIDAASLIASKIKMYRSGSISSVELIEWAYLHLPVRSRLRPNAICFQLEWLVKISAYHLIVFHLGSRVSEALSLHGDSISERSDSDSSFRAQITLTIFKGSKRGIKRTYVVHPYLLKVKSALDAVSGAFGRTPNGVVFSKQDQTNEICANNLNYKVRRFAEMHGREIDMSSHSWRFTLADIVVQAADTPFAAIQYQFDHDHLSESIGYGLNGPSGAEIRKSGVEAARRSIEAFVDNCFEATDVGGIQGRMIKTSIESGAGPDAVKNQMKGLGLFPMTVGKDRFCVKQAHARGACSIATGDDFPEIEHCRADCQFQAQLPSNLVEWENFVDGAAAFFGDKGISFHEKIRKADELLQYVRAWPQLKNRLEAVVSANRPLIKWFT
ncbi:hypothetical protein [Rhizobium leguminosarum]|uniref:hypothetical protein n=1 Tax=Rhizobium leguminosarum TaxID=384 RepID=UPI0013BD145D|nr:hypothetical protein [Rhizobium leguminosarum]NEI61267.1 hypothetical protein [Rhizobium leguminosarum]